MGKDRAVGLLLLGKDRAVRVEQGYGCYLLSKDRAVRVEQG